MSDDKPATNPVVPYAVGYSKPPAESRFKPGTSGNPRGRPPGRKKLQSSTNDPARADSLLLEEAYRPVVLREGERVIELPAIQAVFRAMGVSAMKGNRLAQKGLAELVNKVEAERARTLADHLGKALDYKVTWEREFARCRTAGLPIPEPVPHPDDILIDARAGTVKFAGPMTPQEKAAFDHVISLMKVMQSQVSSFAVSYKKARSEERRATYLSELHYFQLRFDECNDVIGPRYRMELKDRSYHPDASRAGEFAKKMGVTFPGTFQLKPLPDDLLDLIKDQ